MSLLPFTIPDPVAAALPYVITAIVAVGGFAWYSYWLYNKGGDNRELAVRADYEKQDKARKTLRDEIRDSLHEEGISIALGLSEDIRKIKIVNTTVNNQLKTEKEIHHVLESADCAWPPSTLRLRNAARLNVDPAGGRPGAGTAAGMPAATAPTGGQAPAAR